MMLAILLLHGFAAVVLLGALTHQLVALFRGNAEAVGGKRTNKATFVGRYVSVAHGGFTTAVVITYLLSVLLGGLIYPAYRLDVRIPFEEMGIIWAVGLFEVKEHWAGIGLGVLPLYVYVWRPQLAATNSLDRMIVTSLLGLIVWADFIAGHVLNNIRGL